MWGQLTGAADFIDKEFEGGGPFLALDVRWEGR